MITPPSPCQISTVLPSPGGCDYLMIGPKVPETAITERLGVHAVVGVVLAAGCIWRETVLQDVGIDGQIEYVAEQSRVATGRIIAAQIKSGPSYFEGRGEDFVRYVPSEAHGGYWKKFPLPVILVLHNPCDRMTIWADARAALRAGHRAVDVSVANTFDREGLLTALAIEGPLPEAEFDPFEIIAEMIAAQAEDASFGLCFFDLFFNGLTDIAHSVYFGMDLVTSLIEYRSYRNDAPWGIGPTSYAFLDRYVEYLRKHDLALVDLAAWNQMATELGMTGTFVVPLTGNGRRVVAAVSALDRRLPHETSDSVVARERPIRMEMLGLSSRADHIEKFKAEFDSLRRARFDEPADAPDA
jgi:hypothetical protein